MSPLVLPETNLNHTLEPACMASLSARNIHVPRASHQWHTLDFYTYVYMYFTGGLLPDVCPTTLEENPTSW